MADIGFIGLGQMGGAMSRNLVAAGHKLRVHDIDAGAVAALATVGAEAASNPAEAARGAEFVITMLQVGPIVEAVVFGDNGVRGRHLEVCAIHRHEHHPAGGDSTHRGPAGGTGCGHDRRTRGPHPRPTPPLAPRPSWLAAGRPILNAPATCSRS